MYLLVIGLLAVSGASAQLTASTNVAPDLRECYMNTTLLNLNNLPPTTIPVLIDIIQKIEDNPNVNYDLRQIAVLLLHTYRQDGIQYHPPETPGVNVANVIPFSPTFHSFHRHRLLLTRIIPNNQPPFANDTLPTVLVCALHRMLSTTVDARLRGDESMCNQLQQYRALRTGRGVRSIDDDVEMLDLSMLTNSKGQIRHNNPKADVEYTGGDGFRSARQLMGDSQCPLLGGVIHSLWGAISAGTLIAGIAAGAQNQQVPISELVKGSVLNYNNVQQTINSLYPATLSGDLAEACLIQGAERGSSSASVGAGGGWNSTEARRHWMLNVRTNIEMTDPEIRGGVDGFVLGSTINSHLSSYNNLKLSQLLDMYYSRLNGVFNRDQRACNRQQLAKDFITSTTLATETYDFAAALDTNMFLRGTIIGGLDQLVNSAVENFQNYLTTTLHDRTCTSTESDDFDFRMKTNLYIVLDASWQYAAIYPAISYLLDEIEVNKFGSSITLLSAADGSFIVNTTFSLADFHTSYTEARHQSLLMSVNLETVYTRIRTIMQDRLLHEKNTNYVGGNATVLLFLINSGNLQNNQQVWEHARVINETVPDLKVLFATSTNQYDNLWNLVRDVHSDIMTVSLATSGTNVAHAMSAVRNRILEVSGRRIINPVCGFEYPAEALSGNRQFDDYVEPGYINFYSISPNYFYGSNDNRKLKIVRAGAGSGSLVVCSSRQTTQPRQNSTALLQEANDVVCQTLASSGNVEISLASPCSAYYTINSCPFFHISVQSSAAASSSLSAVCTEHRCRYPYNIRYTVQIEEFGCFSSARRVTTSFIFVIATFVLHLFRL